MLRTKPITTPLAKTRLIIFSRKVKKIVKGLRTATPCSEIFGSNILYFDPKKFNFKPKLTSFLTFMVINFLVPMPQCSKTKNLNFCHMQVWRNRYQISKVLYFYKISAFLKFWHPSKYIEWRPTIKSCKNLVSK